MRPAAGVLVAATLAVCGGLVQSAPADALWGYANAGDGGRSSQSGASGPRTLAGAPPGYNHILRVSWRWPLPSGVSQSFYYGAIDAAGALYFLETGNGAAPHVVHKIDGSDGTLLWSSHPTAAPRYGNIYGNDHLIVWSDQVVFVIPGTTYTLADCAWIERLDAATGERVWWLNGTASVVNAVLSSDGAALFASFANGSVARIDAASGAVDALWDLAAFVPATPTVAFSMALVATAAPPAGALDVLVLSCIGNYTGVSTKDGSVLWHIADPVDGEFSATPTTPRPGPFEGVVFTASGGNYQEHAGTASFDAQNGTVRWSRPSSGIISSGSYLASQGWEWQYNILGSGSYSTITVVSLASGAPLANPAYFNMLGFTTGLVVSADGRCAYLFGSGTIDTLYACEVLSFCFNGSHILPEFDVPITGVDAPSHYDAAPGPGDNQLTVWHSTGILRVEPYVLQPGPSPPPPPPSPPAPPRTGFGETVALFFGKDNATCSLGGGNITLTPASLVRAGATAGAPQWVVGATTNEFGFSGTCSAASYAVPVDPAGRRAWVQFSCAASITPYTTYLAELSLGVPGDAPKIVAVCRGGIDPISPLFFTAGVNATHPWFVGPLKPFSRAFYTVSVPPSAPGAEQLPFCQQTLVAELRGAPLFPSRGLFTVDAVPPAGATSGATVYVISTSDVGIRTIGITVPGGATVLDATRPCDTGGCVGSLVTFAGVRNGSLVVGGNSPYYTDWPTSTLAQSLWTQNPSGLPDTFTGLVSTAFPTFPLTRPGALATLADPSSSAGQDREDEPAAWAATGTTESALPATSSPLLWLQNLYLGPTVCTNLASEALLQSVALLGHGAPDAVIVTNETVSACPLPADQRCFSTAVGHVEVFTAV